MKNIFNLNNLTCRLANTNTSFNKAEAIKLIQESASEAGAIHVLHHLEALDKPQSLNHLVWLAEYQGQYIGWIALAADVSEDSNAAYVSIVPYAIYVQGEYRSNGVAEQLIWKSALDTALWSTLELNYRSFEQFQLLKGIDEEVLSLHLEIEARGNTPLETGLIEKISRAMTNAFEQQVEELPYFVRFEQHLI